MSASCATAATSRPHDLELVKITDDVDGRGRRDHRLLPQLPLAAVRRRRPRAADAARCPIAATLAALNDGVRRHRRARRDRTGRARARPRSPTTTMSRPRAPALPLRPARLRPSARAHRPSQRLAFAPRTDRVGVDATSASIDAQGADRFGDGASCLQETLLLARGVAPSSLSGSRATSRRRSYARSRSSSSIAREPFGDAVVVAHPQSLIEQASASRSAG